MSIIYVFAMPSVIHRAYHAFRLTHLLNFLLYALTIAHGLPKLLDVTRPLSLGRLSLTAIAEAQVLALHPPLHHSLHPRPAHRTPPEIPTNRNPQGPTASLQFASDYVVLGGKLHGCI